MTVATAVCKGVFKKQAMSSCKSVVISGWYKRMNFPCTGSYPLHLAGFFLQGFLCFCSSFNPESLFSPAAAAVSFSFILAFLLLFPALVVFGVRSFVLLAVSYQVPGSRRFLCTVTQTFHCILKLSICLSLCTTI